MSPGRWPVGDCLWVDVDDAGGGNQFSLPGDSRPGSASLVYLLSGFTTESDAGLRSRQECGEFCGEPGGRLRGRLRPSQSAQGTLFCQNRWGAL